MTLNSLKDKKILILGLGKEGRDNIAFLRKTFPDKILGAADRLEFKNLSKETRQLLKSNKNINYHLGQNYLKGLSQYDLILKSPGISFNLEELKEVKKKGGVIISQTDIFLENCPGKIVGVTGTKGKSTTTSLIYGILKEAGLKAHLVGNIGKPVLSLLSRTTKKDIYVYELSSHQLAGIRKSPQIAVFLNIFPEHLDYYRNFKEYARAKANITKFQTAKDYLVYNAKDLVVKEIAKKSLAKKINFNSLKLKEIISLKKIPLKGEFNLQNVKAAATVARILKIDDKIIAKAVRSFNPLPHRLELVGKYRGIEFYNDALATIPEATVAALDALGTNVQTIMLGGFERNLSFKKLAKRVLKSKIKTVILFPTTGKRIWQEIVKEAEDKKIKKLPRNFFVDNMEEAVKLAYQHTKKGKICLLSTASSSFSIFKDYKEKGDLFKKYIKKHEKKKKA